MPTPHTDTAKWVFLSPEERIPAQLPAEVLLGSAETCHHLATVVRLRVGESLIVVDAQAETAYRATAQSVSSREIRLLVTDTHHTPVPSAIPPAITLAFGLPKGPALELILQKGTELGCRAFIPLLTERSVVKIEVEASQNKQARWQTILRHAAQQSEGLFLPAIHPPMALETFLAQQAPTYDHRWVAMERSPQARPAQPVIHTLLAAVPRPQSLVLLVGPEGGWSPREQALLAQANCAFLSLGERILRSETAALMFMSIVTYEWHRHQPIPAPAAL